MDPAEEGDSTWLEVKAVMLAIHSAVFCATALQARSLTMTDNYCDYLLFVLVSFKTFIKIAFNIICL